jgi:hypothetical protein
MTDKIISMNLDEMLNVLVVGTIKNIFVYGYDDSRLDSNPRYQISFPYD